MTKERFIISEAKKSNRADANNANEKGRDNDAMSIAQVITKHYPQLAARLKGGIHHE